MFDLVYVNLGTGHGKAARLAPNLVRQAVCLNLQFRKLMGWVVSCPQGQILQMPVTPITPVTTEALTSFTQSDQTGTLCA